MTADSGPAPRTALVAEDSAMSREKIVSILAELGCAVLSAADGLEAVKIAKEQGSHLNLVVLDIQMPKMDGITALRYMRQMPELVCVPIVMLTTQSDTETVRSALTHKATDFIRKDASIPRIAERLRGYLEGAGIKGAAGSPAGGEAQAAAFFRGRRHHRPQDHGLYAVAYETLADLEAAEQGKDGGLLHFYQRLDQAVRSAGQQHPGLGLGYTIEHETMEVTRLAKSDAEWVRLVLVSGRRPDGLALARRVRFVRHDGPPVTVVCESVAALPQEEREAAARAGVDLVERSELHQEQLQALVEQHLVPPWQVTRGGVRHYQLRPGEGPPPQLGQQVAVHFTAMLQDGTVVDDTRKGGGPWQFTLGMGAAVLGLEEGIVRMRPKSVAVFVVPPELAYGSHGRGTQVPPDATLVYRTELVAVGRLPKPDPLVP